MEIAFTVPRADGISHDVICVVPSSAAPRKGDVVEIDDEFYTVDDVEWHITIVEGGSEDFTNGELTDTIVRLTKNGDI